MTRNNHSIKTTIFKKKVFVHRTGTGTENDKIIRNSWHYSSLGFLGGRLWPKMWPFRLLSSENDSLQMTHGKTPGAVCLAWDLRRCRPRCRLLLQVSPHTIQSNLLRTWLTRCLLKGFPTAKYLAQIPHRTCWASAGSRRWKSALGLCSKSADLVQKILLSHSDLHSVGSMFQYLLLRHLSSRCVWNFWLLFKTMGHRGQLYRTCCWNRPGCGTCCWNHPGCGTRCWNRPGCRMVQAVAKLYRYLVGQSLLQ